MLLGVQVMRMERAKTNDVRRYASLIGSRLRSFLRNRFHGLLTLENTPLLRVVVFLRACVQVTLETLVNGLLVALEAAGRGNSRFSDGDGHCCKPLDGVCSTAVMEGVGVRGGVTVLLSEDSALIWTSVVTVP
jgi:hypothetical protein